MADHKEERVVLSCIDGSSLTESVVDYGVFLSHQLGISLELFHAIEHDHLPSKANFSGNLTLGARDDLLEELVSEEELAARSLKMQSKAMLLELKKRALEQGAHEVESVWRHGELYENLLEIKDRLRVVVIGLRGRDHEGRLEVGSQVEEVIRSLHLPVLLVNHCFIKPRRIMIAYDGSQNSQKALEMVASAPLFGKVERHLVNVHQELSLSKRLLEEASKMVAGRIEIVSASLVGEAIEEILIYQKEHEIDIIAMGAFGHHRWREAIFGSFTSKMLTQSPIPLLLLR